MTELRPAWRPDALGHWTLLPSNARRVVVELERVLELFRQKIYESDFPKLQDADSDTLVQVEESADEDVIRFDSGGTERATIDSNGVTVSAGAVRLDNDQDVSAKDTGGTYREALTINSNNDLILGAGIQTGKSVRLSPGGTIKFAVFQGGDALLGTATEPTANGGKVLVLGDNAADPTMGSNTAGVYGKDVAGTVELFGVDEAGNAAQLTPHDEHGEYAPAIKSAGKWHRARLEKALKFLEKRFGGSFWEEIEEDA